MIGFPWNLYSHTRFLWCGKKLIPNTKFLLELIKWRSKVQEKNISCERAFNFSQWKTFSEKYKPMRIWLWLVYRFTENYCRVWLFSKFIQTLKSGILPLLTKYISGLENYLSYQDKFFFVNKTLKELTPCKISHICRCDFNVLSESKENDHITAILICLDINLRFLLKNGNVLKK